MCRRTVGRVSVINGSAHLLPLHIERWTTLLASTDIIKDDRFPCFANLTPLNLLCVLSFFVCVCGGGGGGGMRGRAFAKTIKT